MLKVAITQRVDLISDYNELRDSIDRRLADWVLECGFLPLQIPNNLTQVSSNALLQKWLSSFNPDAFIMSGGSDIGIHSERDNTEICIMDWAKDFKKPLLGICRGMQLMAVENGVKLQNIKGHVNKRHNLIYEEGEEFSEEVLCFHNFGIKECPKDYKVLARTENCFIEAIGHKNLPWEGWMWHPERENIFTQADKNRFKGLVKKIKYS